MKRKTTLPNKVLLLMASLVVIFMVKSCRKDLAGGIDRPIPGQLQWAKSYYESNLQSNQKDLLSPVKTMSNGASGGRNRTNKITIRWDEGYTAKTLLYDFVEVPMNIDGKIMPTFLVTKDPTAKPVLDLQVINASLNRLVIYKDRSGKTNQRIITYVPDRSYLEKAKGDISGNKINSLDENFFGYLQYKDWEGNVLWILRIENGKSVRRINMAGAMSPADAAKLSVRKSSGGNGKLMNYQMIDCGEWTITYNWSQWCYYEGYSQTPNYCDPPEVYNAQATPNCPLGSGPSIDCTNPVNFENPACKEIITKDTSIVNNAKINCLLTKLLGGNGVAGNAQFKALLEAFTGKGFNVTFKIGTVNDPTSKGETTYDPYNPTDYFITLNRNKLNTESEMSWVKTMLHEAFHANLMQKAYQIFGADAVALWAKKPESMDLDELSDYMAMKAFDSSNPIAISMHHEYMAENMAAIRNGLKAFSAAYNPPAVHNAFTDYHFDGLSYEGLNNTSFYMNKVIKNPDGTTKMVDYYGTMTALGVIHTNLSTLLQNESVIPCN